MRNVSAIAAMLTASAVLLALTSCGDRTTSVETATRQGILLIGNDAEPKGLDPQIVTGVTEDRIILALFEGLFRPDPKTLEPEPGVAESYEVSDDGLVYTLSFRDDARWSNGDPVTAHDFVFSYERILSPAFGAQYAQMLYPLKNAEKFNTGKIDDFGEVGVKALDQRTLQLTLERPTPQLTAMMLHFTWMPVHPPTILKYGEMTERGTGWTRPGRMVSNGPFQLEDWNLLEVIEVEKNPRYWDAANVSLEGIHFFVMDSVTTAERAFRTGQVHVATAMPPTKIPVYQERHSEQLYLHPYLGIYYYILNNARPPLDDPRVRLALGLTVDREALIGPILTAGQEPAYAFVPPGTGEYESTAQVPYDPEKARELLAEAGYPNGKGFPKLRLLYNTSESHKLIAEAIQRMWLRELGIEIELFNEEWKTYLETRREGDFDIARAAWIGDYVHPESFLQLMLSGNQLNHSRYRDDGFDETFQAALEASDPAKQNQLFQEAEAIMLADMAVIPIYYYVNAYLVRPSVQGWYPNILDRHPYTVISVEHGEDDR